MRQCFRWLLLAITAISLVCVLRPEVKAQTNLSNAVYGADFYVSPTAYNYKEAAHKIIGHARTDQDKARAIYLWLCEHIEYDRTGNIRTADECWKQRKAVCQGYCELFYRLGEAVGLKVKLVNGLAKHAQPTEELEKHVWLTITIRGREMLLDPTWGAGFFADGKFVHHPSPLMWFCTNPGWFIFTHFPQKKRAQLLPEPLTEAEFRLLPYATPLNEELGLTPRKALELGRQGGLTFPVIPMLSFDYFSWVKLQKAPLPRQLKANQSYTWTISKQQADCRLMLNADGQTLAEDQWQANGGSAFSITYTPKQAGKLKVIISNSNDYVPTRKTILEYDVVLEPDEMPDGQGKLSDIK